MNYQGPGPFQSPSQQPLYPQQRPPYQGPGGYAGPPGPFPLQQQGGYQAPPMSGPPPGNFYMQAPGRTSTGMSQNKAAGLSYLFRWITGLYFLVKEKQNPFVRFHAMQSLMFFGGLNLILIVLLATIFLSVPVVSFVAILLVVLMELIRFFVWIVMVIRGFRGKYFRLPIIGRLAEKYAEEFIL